MDTPTAEEVRLRSELLALRYPADDEERMAVLQRLLDDDAPVVSELTGRSIGIAGTPGEEVPDYLQPVAVRAMALRAERMTIGGSAKARTGAVGALSLRSFTAGPYSESYFGPGEAATAKVLDPDPAIHELLWALATEAKREYWLILWGIQARTPGFAVQGFNYRRQRGGY